MIKGTAKIEQQSRSLYNIFHMIWDFTAVIKVHLNPAFMQMTARQKNHPLTFKYIEFQIWNYFAKKNYCVTEGNNKKEEGRKPLRNHKVFHNELPPSLSTSHPLII